MMMKTKGGTNVRQESSEDGVLRPQGCSTVTSRLVSENRSILECKPEVSLSRPIAAFKRRRRRKSRQKQVRSFA